MMTFSRSDETISSGEPNANDACGACALRSSRREFIYELTAAVAAIAAGLGLPAPAHGFPTMLTSASSVRDDEATYPLPAADGVLIDKEREVILVRWQGTIYAFRLACPHQRTALKWKAKDGRFQCPKHKSKYQPDGTFISGKATRGMDRYAVRRDGDQIVVHLDKVYLEDKDPTGWISALAKV